MKTKLLLTSLALSLSIVAFAQEKTTLEKRITNYSVKIDSIVSSEKEKMNIELNEVEKKFKDGKISETIMLEDRNRISNNYSDRINAKINAEKEDLDEITKASALNSVMGIENDSISKKKEKHPKDLLKSFDIPFSTAYLNTTNENKLLNFSGTEFSNSRSSYIGLRMERQLGKFTSPAFISFGLGLRSDSYNLKVDQVFTQQNNQLQISPFTNGNLKYSYMNLDFIEIPVDFNFVLNPKYIDYEGEKYLDATKNQLRVGVGVYGGLKIGNRIRYKYSNLESKKNVFIQRVENGLNNFEFGAKVSVGYYGINLFLKRDFTSIFNNDAAVDSKYAMQVGIEIISLNF